MTVLLDTDVLVDCLRRTPAACAWMQRVVAEPFQVPGIVAMELIIGCCSRADAQKVNKFLEAFDVVWPEATEFTCAFDLLAVYRFSGGLSIPDSLIAAMAISRSATLYTFNLKHFRLIPGLDVREPYDRLSEV